MLDEGRQNLKSSDIQCMYDMLGTIIQNYPSLTSVHFFNADEASIQQPNNSQAFL